MCPECNQSCVCDDCVNLDLQLAADDSQFEVDHASLFAHAESLQPKKFIGSGEDVCLVD